MHMLRNAVGYLLSYFVSQYALFAIHLWIYCLEMHNLPLIFQQAVLIIFLHFYLKLLLLPDQRFLSELLPN